MTVAIEFWSPQNTQCRGHLALVLTWFLLPSLPSPPISSCSPLALGPTEGLSWTFAQGKLSVVRFSESGQKHSMVAAPSEGCTMNVHRKCYFLWVPLDHPGACGGFGLK